ncbi:PqqD family protein [Streptomyces sanglieri]|uniref:PqqD family protein n=1 Tax=Streptomyces sanglieri TaxID=193460 RepID=UPI003524AE7B
MRLRESTHTVLTNEGGAILNERTGRWTYLTPTATAAVMLLLAGTSEEQAASRFAERYGIGAKQAASDMRTVADTLATRGLAATEPAPAHRWWRWWR